MLELKKIHKHFAHAPYPTLQSLNLKVENGELCMLIGNNGSGKSTLLKIIAGFIRANSGDITLNNQNISTKSVTFRSQFISSACQNVTRSCAGDLSILENMSLSMMRGKKRNLHNYNSYRMQIQQQITSLQIGLEQRLDTPMHLLSGGQQQMVSTLMAMQNHPKLLLLDEHTSALDPKMQSMVMEYSTQQITQRKITTIMITHNLDDAIKYGDRLLMMSGGKIILDAKAATKKSLQRSELIELFHQSQNEDEK